jgi:hypothetical protein
VIASGPGTVAATSTVTAEARGSTFFALTTERPGAFIDVEEGEESTEDEPALDLAII